MEEFLYFIFDMFYILCLFTGFFVITFFGVQVIIDGLVWLAELDDKISKKYNKENKK